MPTPAPTPGPTAVPSGATRVDRPAPPPRPARRRRAGRTVLLGGLATAALVAALTHQTQRPTPAGTGPQAARPSASPAGAPAPATPSPRPSPTPTRRPTPTPTPPTASAPPAPTTGADGGALVAAAVPPARDGDVVLRLTDVRCGATTVGTGDLAYDLPAGRQACTALVTIRNLGTGTTWLPPQGLQDEDGTTYASDLLLAGRLGRTPSELQALPPGATLRSALVWQLPARARPAVVVLKASFLSPGVVRRLD